MKPKSATPYSKEELRSPLPDWPDRGLECPKCHTVIPQFEDLTDDQTARLRLLILTDRKVMAMAELESLTGAPKRWAKIWVIHGGRPDSIGTTAPCPFCGKPLKTARAKQCPHCSMDWHDEKSPKSLKKEPNQSLQPTAPSRRG